MKDLDNLLITAIALAKKSHQNQFDKGGKPYINHPIRVMNSVESYEEKIVAILHDVIEDSDLTLTDLVELEFPIGIVEAIEAITKRNNEDYEAYLQRVIANAIALRVKIADMQDNMKIDRIPNPTAKDRERLRKYQATLPRLLENVI